MVTVILIMSSGMALGLLVRHFKSWQGTFFSGVDALIPYAVWLLLFLLGVSVGSNEIIVRNLGSLGIQALLVSVAAVALSIVLATLVFRTLFKDES